MDKDKKLLIEDFTQARNHFEQLVKDEVKVRNKNDTEHFLNDDGICIRLEWGRSKRYMVDKYEAEIRSKVKVFIIDSAYWWPRTIRGNKQRVAFLNRVIKELSKTV